MRLNSPETGNNPSADVESIRRTVPRRIGALLGNAVDFGADVAVESGKLAVYTAGNVARGVQEIRKTWKGAIKGDSYPETK